MSVIALQGFVPGAVRSPLNERVHWSTRHRWAATWRRNTALRMGNARNRCMAWRTIGPETPKRIVLTAHVLLPMDPFDNLPAALKPVVDGLRDARLIHSDGPDSGHDIRCDQRVVGGPHEARGVTVRVETIDKAGASCWHKDSND